MRLLRNPSKEGLLSLLKDPTKHIPCGDYCYILALQTNIKANIPINLCPFWDKDLDKEDFESGYCHYLKQGDSNSLLWDYCKECSINVG